MKIIALLETSITYGGAFHQGINAIMQMQKICNDKFEFYVLTTLRSNLCYLNQIGIKAKYVKFSLIDKILIYFASNIFIRIIIRKLKFISAFEKKLIDDGVDIVYFLTQTPTPAILTQTQFITTAFDICHRDFPEFPEVREFGEFYLRELHFLNNLASAVLVITDSKELSHRIEKIYGVNSDRLISMPYGSGNISENLDNKYFESVLANYGLSKGYFFYPAQFWAHKNHIRILEALIILNSKLSNQKPSDQKSSDQKLSNSKSYKYRVVFAGGDKGNLSHVKNFIINHKLDNQVKILGFVPQEDMKSLYLGSLAVIMPTYFGPTNIPPLEAWILKKPLIYSTHLKAHAGDAAICVDPDNALELADAMVLCTDKNIVEYFINQGTIRLHELSEERNSSEQYLKTCLSQISARIKCWK